MLVKFLQQAFRRRGAAHSARPQQLSSKLAEATMLSDTACNPADLIATATVHAQNGEWALAEQFLAQALALEPGHAEAHDALGNVLRSQDRIEQALQSYRRALRADPLRVSALSNMALCMRDLGQFDEARAYLEQAATLDPANPVIAMNLAALMFDTDHFDEACTKIDTLLQQHPDFSEAYVVRGVRLLRRGDFTRGWIDYEKRDRNAGRADAAVFNYPVWDGSPMADGYLLVCAEQGLGDQIMFASCIDDLLRIAPNCIIECDARLKPLFARSFPQARIFVQRKGGEEMWLRDGLRPSAKTWIASLPGRFRRCTADFPQRARYLKADSGKIAAWRRALQDLGPGPKIGISWRGGIGSTRRALRSIDLNEWIPLLRRPGTHFVNLQYGDCASEIAQVCSTAGVTLTHWGAAIRDFDETAALVSALDLVISVQTAVVHLAGALGTPVWVLVPKVPEWRYGERGTGMFWYSSAHLFRQERLGTWSDVFVRIHTALENAAFMAPKDE